MPFDGILTVYDKNLNKLAVFPPNVEAVSEERKRNLIVSPTIRQVSNGESSLSFEVLSDSDTWDKIRNIENLYHINDRWYTVLSNDAYEYKSDNGVSVVSVVALETWSLLSKVFAQIYNCGLYVYAKARFSHMTTDGAVFTLSAYDCSNPGKTISAANAWEQVKTWQDLDANGNRQSYAILTADEYKPTGWTDPPSAVFMKSFSVYGNTATMTVESRTKTKVNQVFSYNGSSRTYKLDAKPLPSKIDGVKINSTVVTQSGNTATYNTSDKDVYNYSYNASTGIVTVNYYPVQGETVNGVTISYIENRLGEISPGATCWFACGPEVVDETTVVILPKSSTKYKLTINGISYDDSQVRDSRNVVMPRGSGGYAMWSLLKSTDWSLGVCDVIASGFDPSADFGVFNTELDQKDILYCIQTVAQLYGGILDWDSEHKILNYRAEDSENYQAYQDDFNEWKGQVFREGKNMTEKPNITVDGDLITKAYLLGFGGLSVKGVNGGKSFIEDHSFTDDVFEGYLSQPLIHDTNTTEGEYSGQRQLLYWGKKELAKRCRPRERVTLSVTDLRYLPEYSHEQFFLNDIVKVIYFDEYLGKKVEKEQRVIVWEYNAHALWQSEIELGDVTLNKTDLFKLIYKKVENNPAADNNGNLPGSNIDMSGESNNQNSLVSYIQLIARTTTENSDAIAGLILDTDANHAQATLFAQYEKHMDGLLSQTFAGATAYADAEMAIFQTEVRGKWETQDSQISANIRDIKYVTEKASGIETTVEQHWTDLTQTGKTEIKAVANLSAQVTKDYSYLQGVVEQHWNDITTNCELKIAALAGFKSEVEKTYAKSTMFADYVKTDNFGNELVKSKATITAYADERIAKVQLSASVNGDRATLTLTQNGVTITGSAAYLDISSFGSYNPTMWNNVVNETSALNETVNGYLRQGRWHPGLKDIVSGWQYDGDGTYIDGSMLATDTVIASKIKGGEVQLLDYNGKIEGYIYISPASSFGGYAVRYVSTACEMKSTQGDLHFDSSKHIGLMAHGQDSQGNSISLSAEGGDLSLYCTYGSVKSNKELTVYSDKKLKEKIDYDMSDYLRVFDKLKPCSFKYTYGTHDRKHTGLIAQDMEEALIECGVDTKDFAAFVRSTNEETGEEELGIRYGELVSLCIAKMQEQDKRIRTLEKMIKQ